MFIITTRSTLDRSIIFHFDLLENNLSNHYVPSQFVPEVPLLIQSGIIYGTGFDNY